MIKLKMKNIMWNFRRSTAGVGRKANFLIPFSFLPFLSFPAIFIFFPFFELSHLSRKKRKGKKKKVIFPFLEEINCPPLLCGKWASTKKFVCWFWFIRNIVRSISVIIRSGVVGIVGRWKTKNYISVALSRKKEAYLDVEDWSLKFRYITQEVTFQPISVNVELIPPVSSSFMTDPLTA